MLIHLKKYPHLLMLSMLANQGIAAVADDVTSLPFENTSLLVLSATCVLGVVWLIRAKKK